MLRVLASLSAVEPAIIAGCFMTVNSVLTVYLTRRWNADEEHRLREEDELERQRRRRGMPPKPPADAPDGRTP